MDLNDMGRITVKWGKESKVKKTEKIPISSFYSLLWKRLE
jgi:hypothetical protein